MSLPGPEPPLGWRLLLLAMGAALVSAAAMGLAFYAGYVWVAGR